MLSELPLRLALGSGLGALALTVALVLLTFALHQRVARRQQRERRLQEVWGPIFLNTIEALPSSLPEIPPAQSETVLLAWLALTESVRGAARQRLATLGRQLKLDERARVLLQRGPLRSRLLAVVALGHLPHPVDQRSLRALLDDGNALLSVLAARSLVQTSPDVSASAVIAAHLQRNDWPVRKVAAMLAELPPAHLSAALLDALHTTPSALMPRLLGLLELAHIPESLPLLARLLDSRQPVEILAAALRASHDPGTLPSVRPLAGHPSWVVRAQAATALGRLGGEREKRSLLRLLGDRQWWVRYRAAQALARLPGNSRQRLQAYCEELADPFAINILQQVLAESSHTAAA